MMTGMDRVTLGLVTFVGLQHFLFFVLESFLWQKPVGLKVFRNTPERAKATAALAFNQGFYNAFLGAGLLWGVSIALGQGLGYLEFARSVQAFFLGCVIVAGVVGGMSVSRSILFVQALPAAVALAAVWAPRG